MKIGPELGFGWVMGKNMPQQVLLIKTCWGGRNVKRDFLPPSGDMPPAEQLDKEDGLSGNAVIFDHLGDAYLEANQPEKAKDAWRRAIELFNEEKEPEKAKKVRGKMENDE